MNDLISLLWEGLREAGLPEVMLYLPDGTASRCHWDDTAMIGATRVALLGDQDRNIVRIIPIAACTGIGVPSPKGTDPMNYRATVQNRLMERFGEDLLLADNGDLIPSDIIPGDIIPGDILPGDILPPV